MSLVTFKEKLRTPGFFSKCVEGINHYALANTASRNKMIPLAIALAVANHLTATTSATLILSFSLWPEL